jgi:hypothetical protein
MASLNLDQSIQRRDSLTAARQREISRLYGELARETRQRADALSLNTNISSRLNRLRLYALSDQLQAVHDEMNRTIKDGIADDMLDTAEAVVSGSKGFLRSIGMGSDSAFSSVARNAVEAITKGNIYAKLPNGSNWTLSGAIWQDSARFNGDIERIVAAGLASDKPSLEIARDLERYVSGEAQKDFDWSKAYPGTRKAVDYNAQRLARTLPAHAYQRSLVLSTVNNPFVLGYIWHTAHSHRVCPVCETMDGTFYPKGKLPLDHPNGMCYWECVIPDLELVGTRIGEWASGKRGSVLQLISDSDISRFAESLKKAG